MMYGFRNAGLTDVPEWASDLKHYYWIVRVEKRNEAKRRKYYRKIRKEKLRLVEAGIDAVTLNRVCKYLVSLKEVNAQRLELVLAREPQQLSFNF